jgi:hypothetical protein
MVSCSCVSMGGGGLTQVPYGRDRRSMWRCRRDVGQWKWMGKGGDMNNAYKYHHMREGTNKGGRGGMP